MFVRVKVHWMNKEANLGTFRSQFNRANLYLAQGDLPEARRWAEKAHQNFAEEREFHLVTIGGRYKLACIDMREGLLDDAM